MAEKVIIDIELKGLGDAKKGLDDLTKQQIAQQDEIKKTTAEIKEYEKELASLRKEQEAGGQLTDEQIAREQELTANIQTSKVELASQKDELSKVNAERRAAVKEVDQYNTALNAELGSNEQLKAQLGILTKEYNSLSAEQRENTDKGQQLTTQIKDITDKLKENESAVGDNRRNVGNYSESIQDALGNVTIFGTNLSGLTKSFQQTKEATLAHIKALVMTEGVQKTHTAATNSQTAAQKALNVATLAGKVAMNVFKLALIATGIGAFVVVVGSLVAYFQSTEQGAMKLKVIMAALGSVTANITSKMADFGKIIFDAFNKVKELKISDVFKKIGDAIQKNIMNRIEALGLAGKAIVKIFSGDMKEGFKDLSNAVAQGATGIQDPIGKLEKAGEKAVEVFEKGKEAVKEFAAEVAADAKKAAALQEKENALVFQRRNLLKENAQIEGQVAQLRADAADKANLSQEEIIAKLEEASALESKKLKNLTKIAQTEFDIQKGRSQLATDSAAEAEQLAQKEIALLQAQANEKSGIVRLEKQIAAEQYALQRENLAARLKLIQAQGGDDVATLIEIEKNKREAQLAETSLSELERQAVIAESEKKIADLKLKGLEEEEQQRKEALENELADLDYQQFRELEQANLTAEEKLAIDRKYQKQKAQLELESLTNQATLIKAQLEQITADTGQGLIPPLTPEEEALLKKQLNEINTQMLTIGQTINGIDEEEAGLNLLNGLGLDEAGQEKLNFAIDTVKSSISSIGALMASITERNKKVIQEQVEAGVISQEQADKKLEQIERKAFKRQKAIQISTATANAAQAVLAALAQTTDPTPTQTLRIANAAAIGVLGAVQVATVAAQKFQDGGLIQGASHSQGGVPFSVAGRGGFEAEGGEYIVKKSTVDSYGVDFMNALNNMRIPKMFAEGGYIAPTPTGTISDQVSRGVSELVSANENRQMQVINVEQDFTKLQTKVLNVEQARTY
jgi:polyhydroxyalkanoate synthesis regulator phasin